MEHPYILPYITQRMKELGHDKFHYETVRVKRELAIDPVSNVFYDYITFPGSPPYQFSNRKFYILAHNQYYFIVEKTVDPTLTIKSDTGCLTMDEAINYSNYTFFNFKEFTGQIYFEQAIQPIDIEFIKCTPYN